MTSQIDVRGTAGGRTEAPVEGDRRFREFARGPRPTLPSHLIQRTRLDFLGERLDPGRSTRETDGGSTPTASTVSHAATESAESVANS